MTYTVKDVEVDRYVFTPKTGGSAQDTHTVTIARRSFLQFRIRYAAITRRIPTCAAAREKRQGQLRRREISVNGGKKAFRLKCWQTKGPKQKIVAEMSATCGLVAIRRVRREPSIPS